MITVTTITELVGEHGAAKGSTLVWSGVSRDVMCALGITNCARGHCFAEGTAECTAEGGGWGDAQVVFIVIFIGLGLILCGYL